MSFSLGNLSKLQQPFGAALQQPLLCPKALQHCISLSPSGHPVGLASLVLQNAVFMTLQEGLQYLAKMKFCN